MNAARIGSGSIKELAIALTGPVIWAAHFFAVYTAEAFLCNGGTPSSAAAAVRPIGFVAAVAALGIFVAWQALPLRRSQPAHSMPAHSMNEQFLREISIGLAAMALLAVVWGALPAVLLPTCMAAT